MMAKCRVWDNVPDIKWKWIPGSRLCDSKQAICEACPCPSYCKIAKHRWSQRSQQWVQSSLKYTGAVPRTTSNIKTHNFYVMRLATGSQCSQCSSGAAWLKTGSKQTRHTALFWIRFIRWWTATLQFAKRPL